MRFFILIAYIFIAPIYSFSQRVNVQDSILNKVLDTVKGNESSNQVMELMMKEEYMRYKDSLQRETIIDDLNNAKSIAKRKKLEQELAVIQYNDSIKLIDIKKQIERLKKEAIPYHTIIDEDTIRVFRSEERRVGKECRL